MAFTNDDKQEIKAIVQEVIDEQADPIEDTTQVDALEEGDIVAIVRAVGGVNSYKKASVGLFGGGGGSIKVDSHLDITSTNPVQNKVVTTALNGKQATLIGSGTGQNIKTVNGQSLLGTGDIPASGGAGTVPVITATATVDATTGTPAVSVVKSGTDTAPNFAFAFTGLKGEPGSGGGGGGTGTVTGAKVGQEGAVINPDQNGIVTLPAYEANADVTDAENVKNALGVQQGGTRYLKEDGSWDTPAGGGGGTQKGTKVYLAANGGVLPVMESTNVVYVISYAYTISGSVTVPAGCALEFAGGSIDGGTLVLNGTYLYGNIKFGTGITISGTCKNGTAYQKWFTNNDVDAWHRFINNVDCPCYEYEFGSYTPTVYVNKEVENKHSVSINGNNATLTYPYAHAATTFYIRPKNADTYRSASITAVVSKGDRYVTVSSASNLHVGDIVSLRDNTICSFSPFRTAYKQCEFANIAEISGTTLKLTHPVYGVYKNVGSCYVYAFNTISCHIRDLEIRVSNPTEVVDKFTGIEIAQCVGLSLTNVRVYDFKVSVRIYASSNVMVENCSCKVTDTYVQVSSSYPDSYALSICNCQNMTVLGGDFVGGRHAISIGGRDTELSIIDREILVKNASAKNVGLEVFQMSIDMHGDSEYVTIEGCNTEGINIRGKNNKLLNNFIYGYQIAANELCNYNHEIIGNVMRCPYIGIGANELATYSSGNTYYIYDEAKWFMTSTDYTEDCFVIANNKSVDGEKVEVDDVETPQLTIFIAGGIGLAADGTYPGHTYYNIANTKLVVEGNTVRNAIPFISGFNTIIMRNNVFDFDACNAKKGISNSAKPRITASRVLIEGNKFFGYGRQSSSVLSGTFFRVSGDVVSIKNNYAQSSEAYYALFSTIDNIGELFVEGNIAKDKFFISTKNHLISKVVIAKNTFIDTSTTGGGPFGVTVSSSNTSLRTDAIITDNILGDTKCATIQYANNVTYGRNLLYGAMTIVSPYIPSSTGTVLNLDAGSAPSNVNYSTTTYDVATTSDNGNTSGTVTIDGTKAVTVLAITGDVTSLELASGKNPEAGHSAHVILSASSARSVTITHNSTSRICPGAANLSLSIPAGGYAEVDFINANSKIYVRGV